MGEKSYYRLFCRRNQVNDDLANELMARSFILDVMTFKALVACHAGPRHQYCLQPPKSKYELNLGYLRLLREDLKESSSKINVEYLREVELLKKGGRSRESGSVRALTGACLGNLILAYIGRQRNEYQMLCQATTVLSQNSKF